MVVIPAELSWGDMATRLLAIVLLIGLNAFFVTAEFSIVSVRRSRISQLISQGDVQAKPVQQLQQSLDRLLSTTQLGITLSSLALGWIGESTMAVLMAYGLSRLPLPLGVRQGVVHAMAIPLAFFLIAYLQIVLGELCPKALALLYPERLARLLSPPSLTIARLFHPFIWVLNQSTRLLLRLVGIRQRSPYGYSRLTPEELQLIIQTSAESPGLDAEERELLNNVFEFRDVTAEEVMIPRTQIDAVPVESTFSHILTLATTTAHSRYPVIRDSLDDICGLIDLKDLIQALAAGTLTPASPIQPWVRPARFVPEHMALSDLLATMQRTGQELVIVVDQFGGTAGLVTLRDLTAEIMGDFKPEESGNPQIKMLDDQSVLIPAQTDIDAVNDLLGTDLPLTDDYQTLAGFVIYQLQKIPDTGEQLTYADYDWVVWATDGPRLQTILVRPTLAPDSV